MRDRAEAVELRKHAGESHIALRDGPEVWRLVSVAAPEYRNDEEVLVRRFEAVLTEAQVRQSVLCYTRFRERVDHLVKASDAAVGTLEQLPAWSLPRGGLRADWTVSAETLERLRNEDVDIVHAAELEKPVGPTAALPARASEKGWVLMTVDYRGTGILIQNKRPTTLSVALLDLALVRARLKTAGSAVRSWWKAGSGRGRQRWIRTVEGG